MSKKDQTTILVGDSTELLSFYLKLKRPERVLGIFCDVNLALPSGLNRLGSVDEAAGFLDENTLLQRVYCSMSQIHLEQLCSVQYACKARAVQFCLVPPVVNDLDVKLNLIEVGKYTLLTPRKEPLAYPHNRILKRTFDLVLTLLFMLTVFPFIYLFKAPFIKHRKCGKPFIKQRCCGPNGRIFNRISFRFDKRSWGRIFNVLIGNMSLVGPDCYLLNDMEGTDTLPKRLERRGVKSGMTGWAHVKHCDETNRLAADIYYVEHWSLWLDIRILFKSMF